MPEHRSSPEERERRRQIASVEPPRALLNRDKHHADDGGGEPNDLVQGGNYLFLEHIAEFGVAKCRAPPPQIEP